MISLLRHQRLFTYHLIKRIAIRSATSSSSPSPLDPISNKIWKRINNIESSTNSHDESKPIFSVDANDKPLDQLKQLIEIPLWELSQKLNHKSFEAPYTTLNSVESQDIDIILNNLQSNLHQTFQNYLTNKDTENPNIRKIEDIKLIDFFNPKLVNITQIIYSINNNQYPKNFLKFSQVNSKLGLLTQLLTNLLYKEYMELKILTTKPENNIFDISNPAEWFPEARKMKRKVIMHVGPTNSGKTYNSLKTLSQAKSGYYAGPLRLLAREIYEKFNHDGIKCNLITGEEVIPSMDEYGRVSQISSGTIEMIPLHRKMDVCIIDEIQMIADDRRGASWTNAFLGVLAKEIHLCGEESAVPLIQKLTKITGDELEIKTYKRLGKLSTTKEPVNILRDLKSGDCVICFSKRKILELKCQIEQKTNLKVGVVYGALPPEIRSQEAQNFNEGTTDVLIASDAIGMGLNLKIKRVIFHSLRKFNGSEMADLAIPSIKQIGGRAGRYSQEFGQSEGFVSAMNKRDINLIQKAMKSPIINLKKACVWPTDLVWKHYMSKFPPSQPFYDILQAFAVETVQLKSNNYFITELDFRYEILKLFLREDLYKELNIEDQLVLSLAPINLNMASDQVKETAFKFFQMIRNCESKNIFDFNFLNQSVITQTPKITASVGDTVNLLTTLEDYHKLVLLFMWLSQRWPTLFVDKESASDMKSLIEKRISQELINMRRMNSR
ncbi:P-loop containing nucleoside triphosphate hydrolase protein [Scheffersomyces coipomensis]|uniref:P-loop containing nucleoside triphosphate hydrolase protein n=1 Tax=Scheffersomyces coipomensis TaxID=1788519 RepID=UPI00315C53A3